MRYQDQDLAFAVWRHHPNRYVHSGAIDAEANQRLAQSIAKIKRI